MTKQDEIDELVKEEIVMTPFQRMGVTTIKIERMPSSQIDYTLMHYSASGPYAGIVVNKALNDEPDADEPDLGTPHAMFSLKVFMSDASSDTPDSDMVEENRTFKFWFLDPEDTDSLAANANEFFNEMVDPEEFPKDYIGFIKRVVILVRKYLLIKRMELEMSPSFENSFIEASITSQQSATQQELHVDTVTTTTATIEKSPSLKRSGSFKERRIPTKKGRIMIWVAKKQRLLNVLEDAYPNMMPMAELCRLAGFSKSDMETATYMLTDLMEKGLVKEIDSGRWMRLPRTSVEDGSSAHQHEVRVVKDLPIISSSEQPSIAIVTLLYCEKLAVDAMMEKKTTFVKYKTEGESQVYTIGMIGPHKVVTTKLARTGSMEGAMISAGNLVTRLLGTFNKIEHVLLVGVGGGVPNFSDASQHVRLGDIIVALPTERDGPIYIHCGKLEKDKSFMTQTYAPRDPLIQELVETMQRRSETDEYYGKPWERYQEQGMKLLQNEETRFERPPPGSDKLYRTLNGSRVEVPHPGDETDAGVMRPARVHYGPLGSGKPVVRSEEERLEFAMVTGVIGYDADYHAVLDSIEGNRKDSFALIRGISDYVDGTRKKFEWQAYAAVAAAAYMKALVLAFPVEDPTSP